MYPRIGIPCQADFREESGRPIYCNNRAYVHALEQAGAIPLLMPPLADEAAMVALLSSVDGLLLSGGADIDPGRYGEEPHERLGRVDEQLDEQELALVQYAMQMDMPVLGICRGIQLLNVALGGSLYQDLSAQHPTSIDHSRRDLPRNTLTHSIQIEPDSRMASILGVNEAQVNSLHHQAVKDLGQGAHVSGYAEDGVVELMEVSGYRFVLATQCHPEEIYTVEPVWARLFAAFVQECDGGAQTERTYK